MKSSTKVLSVVLTGLMLGGCGGSHGSKHSSAAVYAPASKDTLNVANGSEPDSLDPGHSQSTTSANILYAISEGLMSDDQSNKAVPGLADSWTVSKDLKTYTFHIRDNAKFSDGNPVTAQDFLFAFRREVTPKTASEMAYKFAPIVNANAIMAGKAPVDSLGVKAIDDHTLQIKLTHPVFYFLNIMADSVAAPIEESAFKKNPKGFFAKPYPSTGPYHLTEWVPNGHITVAKNKYYWNAEHVAIPKVKYFPIASRNSAYEAYAAGRVDWVLYIPTANLKQIKEKYGHQLRSTPWLDLEYLDFNLTKAPFKDNLNLRKALTLAINREALTTHIAKGAVPVYAPFPPSIAGGAYKDVNYVWKDWSQDKRDAEAKKLFAKTGYTKANPLKLDIVYNTDAIHKKVMTAIAGMWDNVFGGAVKATAENFEFKVLIKNRQSGNYEVARDGWVADFNTIDDFLNMWMKGNPQNESKYNNPEYNALMKKAEMQPNAEAAKLYFTKAAHMVMKDYPIAPIYAASIIHLVKPYIKGYHLKNNAMDHLRPQWMSFNYAPKKSS